MLSRDGGQHRPSLRVDPILTQVARARAADLARRDYFAHVNPDGHGPNWLVSHAGYPLPAWWGDNEEANYVESIAAGHASASATYSDWMDSSPHRTHLLATDDFYADQTSVGVGYVYLPGSEYGYYWVVITAPPAPTPRLAIAAPVAGARVSIPRVALSGNVGGGTPAQAVQFRVENAAGIGAFQDASGVAKWSGTATGLLPGANTIRVRSIDAAGKPLAEATRSVNYVVMTSLSVSVQGDGRVSDDFAGTSNREAGRRYTVTARAADGALFQGWSGSISSTRAVLSFTMAEGMNLTANFVPNPFLTPRGGYRGLVQGGGENGLLTVAVSGDGDFTGRLRLGCASLALRGRFEIDGTATLQIPRRGAAPLSVSLQLDLAGGGVSGSVTDGAWTAQISTSANFAAAAGRFAKVGRYTVSLPPRAGGSGSLPQGDGFATLTISATGHATLVGALADGTPFTVGGGVSKGDTLAFHVPLYAGAGAITGQLVLRESAVSDLDGSLHWVRPAQPGRRFYAGGFQADQPIVGSRYTAPAAGTPVVEVEAAENNSRLLLGGGDLDPAVVHVQPTTLDTDNHISLESPILQGLRVTIQPATGRFSGSFIHPATGVATKLHGVIFQKQNAGFGYFLGLDESGYTSFAAAE